MNRKPLAIPLQPVPSSSLVVGVGYDRDARVLAVRFKNGQTWHYDGVDEGEFEAMMRADSVGKYFHNSIKDQYRASPA